MSARAAVVSRHAWSAVRADCPSCGEMCDAEDTNAAAHRRWARQHVEQHPTHKAHLQTDTVRVYEASR